MRSKFLLYFLFVHKFDLLDRVNKEETDRKLLGPIQFTAVYWAGGTTILRYRFVFETNKIFEVRSKNIVHINVYSLVVRCV